MSAKVYYAVSCRRHGYIQCGLALSFAVDTVLVEVWLDTGRYFDVLLDEDGSSANRAVRYVTQVVPTSLKTRGLLL